MWYRRHNLWVIKINLKKIKVGCFVMLVPFYFSTVTLSVSATILVFILISVLR